MSITVHQRRAARAQRAVRLTGVRTFLFARGMWLVINGTTRRYRVVRVWYGRGRMLLDGQVTPPT